MGLFGSMKDPGVYSTTKDSRAKLSGSASNTVQGQFDSEPGTYWGQSYGDFTNRYGLDPLQPQGGLNFDYLRGGPGDGGPGGGYGYASAGHASAGHATASLVDINSEPYQTKMNEAVAQEYLGRGHKLASSMLDQQNRSLDTAASLSGMSPVARAYMKQLNAQKSADMLGDTYGQFETDWVKSALNRQDQARQLNAQLGTHVSETNAQEAGATSRFNAGEAGATSRYNAGLGETGAGRTARASEFLLGLWDRNQDRDVGRYGQVDSEANRWMKPTSEKQYERSGFGQFIDAGTKIAGAAAAWA